MKIQTRYLGEVEISEDRILHFDYGIPSFLDEKEFILQPFDESAPFYILQSVTTPELGFVVVSPFDFFPDYQVNLADSTIEALKIINEADVAIFTILTVQEPFTNTTVNLQGPVVINTNNQKAKQTSLNDPNYHTKHLLMPQPVGQEG